MDDVAMMQTLLLAHKDKATTANLWHALLALPAAQTALGDATLAKALLARAPVLRTAPEVKALDEQNGWGDAARVQAAMGAAIRSFADMALATMQQTTTATMMMAGGGVENRNWPTRVLNSLTDEEAALSQRVAQQGDVDALGELMDSQAARHFGGAFVLCMHVSVVGVMKGIVFDY